MKFPVAAPKFPVTWKYLPVSLTGKIPQKWLQRNGFWLSE
jgi:hypothetical protein